MAFLHGAAFVIDFGNKQSCAAMALAAPGQKLDVAVRLEGTPRRAPSLWGKGRRSDDGERFHVEAIRPDGKVESHAWTWPELLDALRIHGGVERGG